jgi:hypothetical protein
MDYGALIQDAWRLTWRYRFLWVLGLFAGGTIGFSGGGGGASGWRQPQQQAPMGQEDADAVARNVTTWMEHNVGLVAALAASLILLGLVILGLRTPSMIC